MSLILGLTGDKDRSTSVQQRWTYDDLGSLISTEDWVIVIWTWSQLDSLFWWLETLQKINDLRLYLGLTCLLEIGPNDLSQMSEVKQQKSGSYISHDATNSLWLEPTGLQEATYFKPNFLSDSIPDKWWHHQGWRSSFKATQYISLHYDRLLSLLLKMSEVPL